jgi:G3E family GTPase
MDPDNFINWMQSTAQEFGPDALRMKGIISFAGDNDRFVVKAVRMLLEGYSQRGPQQQLESALNGTRSATISYRIRLGATSAAPDRPAGVLDRYPSS